MLIGTVFIFSGVELTPQEVAAQKAQGMYDAYLRTETLRVVKPYLVIGVIALIWAFLILRTKFPSIQSEHENSAGDHGHFSELFRYPHFLLAVLAQFLYVGAQVGTWSYFIQYVQEYTHQPEKVAGYFLTGTLAAFGVGRFVSAYLMRFIPPNKLMGRTAWSASCWWDLRVVTRVDWPVVPFPYQLFHVLDVSNHICAGTEGTGPQHKNRRVAAGHGDRWRSRVDSDHGPDL